jgi:cell division protein FtsA
VIGIGSHESRGLKRGVVVDIESTVQSIQRAVEEAELMAGCEVRSVYASISGNHVQCRNSQGIAPIRDGEVTYADLDRVLDAGEGRGDPGRPEDPARHPARLRASTIRRKASAIPSA